MRMLRTIGVLLALAGPACAQTSVADFYRGKTITILFGGSAGGGYDTDADRKSTRLNSSH